MYDAACYWTGLISTILSKLADFIALSSIVRLLSTEALGAHDILWEECPR